jgi:cytochrome oxidase assembly protein ShyY1
MSSPSTTALFSALSIGTGALGAWQIRRYFWKLNLLEERDASLRASPTDVSSGALSLRPFSRVSLRGATADASNLSTVEPRVAPADLPPSLAALTRANAGRCVVVPLLRADGTRVLALAGWVPADADAAEAARAWARGLGGAAAPPVEGVVRDSEVPGVWAAAHGASGARSAGAPPSARVFSHIDVPALAAAAGLDASRGDGVRALVEVVRPFPERAGAAAGAAPGAAAAPWPVTRQLPAMRDAYVQPHTHLIYAGTWLALATYGAFATWRHVRGRGVGRSERRLR